MTTPHEIEYLYIRSLDQPLSEEENQTLVTALRENLALAKDLDQYKLLREKMLRTHPETFGPYFAQKVIMKIQNMRVEIDQQIVFFFRKYQLAAVGVVIALLAINAIFADKLDIPSLLGVEDVATAPAPPDGNRGDDDLLSFDYYENLTDN